jgi:hypothetical protein
MVRLISSWGAGVLCVGAVVGLLAGPVGAGGASGLMQAHKLSAIIIASIKLVIFFTVTSPSLEEAACCRSGGFRREGKQAAFVIFDR